MSNAGQPQVGRDTASISVACEGGSIGTIHYFSNGDKRFPKERIDVFSGGKIVQIDNFRRMRGFGVGKLKHTHALVQNKGHREAVDAFLNAVRYGRPSPISLSELIDVTQATFTADQQLREEARVMPRSDR